MGGPVADHGRQAPAAPALPGVGRPFAPPAAFDEAGRDRGAVFVDVLARQAEDEVQVGMTKHEVAPLEAVLVIEVNQPFPSIGVALPAGQARVGGVLVPAPDRLGEPAVPAALVGVDVPAVALDLAVGQVALDDEGEVHGSLRAMANRSGPRPLS